MKYLAFDTSGSRLTVASGGNKKIILDMQECFHSHSVVLMEQIESCLLKAEVDLKDIDVFACSVGPGSFTGIRIGVSTAKAFAYALSKKVLGVTSFESLAYNVVEKVKKLTVIDARHDNFYVCGFDENNAVIIEPCFKTKQEIIDLYKDFLIVSDVKIDGLESVVGDMAQGFVEAVEHRLCESKDDRESLVPLYVKKSQAEEEVQC
ncbi:MAG: tRNA (adenosine(37)-N6)-threonylcarbamoyltransferase complex dimerization subunit type 1 TsaB [Clostridia bacterium]|nr:tRNA (adenosine(37)-N6)-threonylcarbamoyltransferase complex dimerization subunit type 1 TsaB [Clostridia bacterium]